MLADLSSIYRQVVFFSSDASKSENIKEDLELLLPERQVCFFPVYPKSRLGSDRVMTKEARQRTLETLSRREPAIVVAHADGLQKALPKATRFSHDSVAFSIGTELDFNGIIETFGRLGFVRETRVEQSGEMSIRGGIIDVYPHSADQPYRIEFWSDVNCCRV